MPHLLDKKNVDMLTAHKIYSVSEIQARCDIMLENYCKAVIIEANTIPGFNTAQYRSYAWVTDGYGYQPLFDELNGRPFVNNDHYARVLLKLD